MIHDDQKLTRFRLKLITNLSPLLFIAILIRLFYWQVIKGPQLSIQASRQHSSVSVLQARRGNIYDTNGELLAGIKNLYHLYIYKPQMKDSTGKIVDILAPILVEDPPPASPGAEIITPEQMLQETKDFLTGRVTLSSNWISIKHYLTPEQRELIDSQELEGLDFEPEYLRYYPESSLSAHILGFVGKDLAGQEQGYFGIEGFFDRQLKGRSGKVRGEKDAYGNPILIGNYQLLQSQNGDSLKLTIDKPKQFLIENLLIEGMARYGARSGTVTVMETSTGKIRSLASFPNYDPGNYPDYNKDWYKNPVVASLFEPGSVFKPIIMASALEKKVINQDSTCDICTGPIEIGQFSIKTWDEVYHPDSNMTDILVNSDNTGMVFVSRKLGSEDFLKTLDSFGFNATTGIELQEEATGKLKQGSSFREIDLATNAFGQGIAITRIQLLTAFNALANKGLLVQPTLIEKEDQPPSRKVLEENTTKQITQMLIEVVNQSKLNWKRPQGLSIAGKTGTAQIPVDGKYDQDKTIASFIGYFPAYNPKYTMLVTLTEPTASPWGSETAAPLWFKILNQLLL
ncbi:penicillin-binding protein 2 [Patescibacteria group bacterium]|nr:penicillin-binding protein 2 [Patescibacteria group bacterium]